MKTRTIALTIVTCFVGLTLCFAESPMMGTWKLNEAKSKFSPGASKSITVAYEADGDNMKCTIDGVDGTGKPYHNVWVGKFDGKDYPVTGDSEGNTRAVKKINSHTFGATNKKDGKVTTSGRIVIAADGKTRTLTLHGTDAMGKKTSETAVYDKQ
ncbi:MAG: hypothetical protein WA172_17565 [Terriglobales bacterium]